MIITRKQVGKLTADARLGPRSLNKEKRTVQAVASTGSRGARNGFDESLDIRGAKLDRLNSGRAPLLDGHDYSSMDSILGTVTRAWVDADNLMVEVRFAETERGNQAMGMVERSEIQSLSIGYNVKKYEDITQKSDTRSHYIARDWDVLEVSLVSIPFDQNAVIRNLETEETEIHTRAESAKGNTMTPQEAALAERTRIKEIKNMVRNAGLDQTFEDDLIDRGVSSDEARKEVLAQMSKRATPASQIDNTQRVNVDNSNELKRQDQLVSSLVAKFTRTAPPACSEFEGRSLLRNFERIVPRRLGDTDLNYARRVMSSSDLPYILSNSAEKSIANRLKAQQPTWSQWANSDTVRNYKTKDLLKSSQFPSLLERQEGAEFKHGSLSEEREQVTMKDWGIMMSFTRRMLVNDDLSEIQAMIGQSASAVNRLENSLVYSILTSNPVMADEVALFHADHENLLSAAALTDATISEAFQKMREQTSFDGLSRLNLAPKYLICGPSQEAAAKKYLAVLSPSQASNVNPFSSSLEIVVDAEITTNDYFFACDKSQQAGISLFRLEGEESPRVESRTAFETENVEVKVAHAAVAKAVDHRGLCKSANAS